MHYLPVIRVIIGLSQEIAPSFNLNTGPFADYLFRYLLKIILDKSILKHLYFIVKTEALHVWLPDPFASYHQTSQQKPTSIWKKNPCASKMLYDAIIVGSVFVQRIHSGFATCYIFLQIL